MKKIPVLCLSDNIRPASELSCELANESENFFELALVLAQADPDRVAFVWHGTNSTVTCKKIETLIERGWVPPAYMGVTIGERLLAPQLRVKITKTKPSMRAI